VKEKVHMKTSRAATPALLERATGVLLRTVAWTLLLVQPLPADDWPTFQYDNRRSAATAENLPLPLQEVWPYRSPVPPQTAWSGPAPWDSFARKVPLAPMRLFDRALFVTVVGEKVFFGSSVDDAMHCLDAGTGKELWYFLSEGPVRLPPTFYDGKLYFGSDDGCAYCINAANGSPVWKYRAAPDDRQIPSDGKLISLWPVRTGVLVQDGKACFAASLLPWRESYVCALDAQTGSASAPGCYQVAHGNMTMQGAMLASSSGLYVSQGRLAPVAFRLGDGSLLGRFGANQQGGVFALLTPDDNLVHGRGIFQGGLWGDAMGFFPSGNHMVVTADRSYVHTDTQLIAMDRARMLPLAAQKRKSQARQAELEKRLKQLGKDGPKEEIVRINGQLQQAKQEVQRLSGEIQACSLWKKPCQYPYALILAGDALFVGGEDAVAAFRTTDGEILWTGKITGRAFGLAAANGHLLISTDQGTIHCLGKRNSPLSQ
jgi:outer membrane protein assembly factor BamB